MPDRATANKSRIRRTPGFSQRLARYSAGTLTLAGSAGLAHAQFSGMYAVTPPDPAVYTLSGSQTFGTWTSTELEYTYNGGTATATLDDTQAPTSLTLSTIGAPDGEAEETFTNTAATAEFLSFSYTANPDYYYKSGGTTYSDINLLINGVETPLDGSGTISNVALAAGDTFGFSVTDSYGNTSSLTVSNFAVPEPGTAGWIAAGAAGLLATRALRRRNARTTVEG